MPSDRFRTCIPKPHLHCHLVRRRLPCLLEKGYQELHHSGISAVSPCIVHLPRSKATKATKLDQYYSKHATRNQIKREVVEVHKKERRPAVHFGHLTWWPFLNHSILISLPLPLFPYSSCRSLNPSQLLGQDADSLALHPPRLGSGTFCSIRTM